MRNPLVLSPVRWLLSLFISVMLCILLVTPAQAAPKTPSLTTKIGGDFSLESPKGPISLATFEGQVMVISFGYTSCPDVCPTTLVQLTQAFNQLTPDEIDKVSGLFVSVDPNRDSIEHLANYTGFFHPSILGATADKAEIDKMTRAYGAFYRIGKETGSAAGYAVDHSSYIYLIDTQGQFAKRLSHSTDTAVIAKTIQQLLNK